MDVYHTWEKRGTMTFFKVCEDNTDELIGYLAIYDDSFFDENDRTKKSGAL
jgi:hypothetical protein